MHKCSKANLFAGTILFALAGASIGMAQTSPPPKPKDDATAVKEVVITGSRIKRTDLTAPQPVSVLTSQYIQDRGITNIADAINELPSAGVAVTPEGDQSDYGTGRNYINLFNLGTGRTLTLVNGRRFVGDNATTIFSSGDGNEVDLNALPNLFVDRVEEVPATGAAVYGSDAVAGVVNIIMKDRFTGFQIDGEEGLSDKNDYPRSHIEAAAGKDFLDGRLNIAADVEWDRTGSLLESQRAASAAQYEFAANPADTGPNDGIPANIVIKNGRSPEYTSGGLPLLNSYNYDLPNGLVLMPNPSNPSQQVPAQFGPGGNLIPYNTGTIYQVGTASGGDGYNIAPVTALESPLNRKILNLIGTFEVTPHVRLHAQFYYSRVDAIEPVNQPNYNVTLFGDPDYALSISIDNPFLTTQARNILIANGVNPSDPNNNTFLLSRAEPDLGINKVTSRDITYDAVLNLEGDFRAFDRDFTWNVAATQGDSSSYFDEPSLLRINFDYAVDAVTGPNGQPACRVTVNNPGSTDPTIANCKPLNLFGVGSASAAALQYINGDFASASDNQQTDFQANLGGSLYKLPAGDWKVNAGFEYRREQASFSPNALSSGIAPDSTPDDNPPLGYGRSVPVVGSSGAFDTKEFYVETLVPILEPGFNLPLAYKFELEGAYRTVDNSLAGHNNAWSYGGRFSPIPDVTFRGSRSVTFRAPAVLQLFANQQSAYDGGYPDPCDAAYISAGPNPTARERNCAALFQSLGLPANYQLHSDEVNYSVPVTVQGNPQLKNELGSSWTYGVVLQPHFIPGLSITVDYVHINITNAITSSNAGEVLSACFDSPTYPVAPFNACNRIVRDSGAQILSINEPFINLGTTEFAADTYAVAYERDINRLPFVDTDRDLGHIGVDINIVNTMRYLVSASGMGYDTVSEAGVVGYAPHWRWHGDLTYSYGPFKGTWTTEYIGSEVFDPTYTIENQSPLSRGEYYLHDLSLEYEIKKGMVARLNVNNVFDAQPPYPSIGVGTYDQIGRYFLVGFDAKF